MPARWNCFLVAVALAFFASTGARAWPESDLWSDPADPGWGLTVHRQGDVTFAVLFVQGPDSRGVWYVASDLRQRNGDHLDPIGTPILSGRLYRPSGAGRPPVDAGTMEIAHLFPDNLSLSYVIDGVRAQKTLRRLTWADGSEKVIGDWSGGFGAQLSPCAEQPAAAQSMRVRRIADGRFSITFNGPASWPLCEASAAYTQAGSLGNLAGTYECRASSGGTVANSGALEITEILIAEGTGWTGRMRLASGECIARGTLGLARTAAP